MLEAIHLKVPEGLNLLLVKVNNACGVEAVDGQVIADFGTKYAVTNNILPLLRNAADEEDVNFEVSCFSSYWSSRLSLL